MNLIFIGAAFLRRGGHLVLKVKFGCSPFSLQESCDSFCDAIRVPLMRAVFFITAALTALASAQTENVYQLRWVGDYQTGAWDTDAAENIAFDSVRARAFIASAESGTVKVVSVTDPTDMSGARATPTGTDSHASAHAPLRRAKRTHTHIREPRTLASTR